jgi:hypothetical protein
LVALSARLKAVPSRNEICRKTRKARLRAAL